ncbi:hypothetical protein KP79_PYT23253 [Mizuhopecten yessoensis]|uniref:Uncharacterized protein n=1 Tax=Mizuhopecten yessoensis TaxID=6573 RepID=A0A210Q615_MIZYE|nr:hypothetical protein KP79_PYT23253 [Mizuhopecten yessoensis]
MQYYWCVLVYTSGDKRPDGVHITTGLYRAVISTTSLYTSCFGDRSSVLPKEVQSVLSVSLLLVHKASVNLP